MAVKRNLQVHTSVRSSSNLFASLWPEEDVRFFNIDFDGEFLAEEWEEDTFDFEGSVSQPDFSDARVAAGSGAEPRLDPKAFARPHEKPIATPAVCSAVPCDIRPAFLAMGIDTYSIETEAMTPLRERMVRITQGAVCADGHSSVAERIARCGTRYQDGGIGPDGPVVRLLTYCCHQFGCPRCSAIDAIRQAESMRRYLEIRSRHKPQEAFIFATITQQKKTYRKEKSKEALKRLSDSWGSMMRKSRSTSMPDAVIAQGYLIDGSARINWRITHDHNMNYTYSVYEGGWISRAVDPLKTDLSIQEFLEEQGFKTFWHIGSVFRTKYAAKSHGKVWSEQVWSEHKSKRYTRVYRVIHNGKSVVQLENGKKVESSKDYIFPMKKNVMKAVGTLDSSSSPLIYEKVDKNSLRKSWGRYMATKFIEGGYRHTEMTWSPRGAKRSDGSVVAFDGVHPHSHLALELRFPPQWWLNEMIEVGGEERTRLDWIRGGSDERRFWIGANGECSDYDPSIVYNEWRLYFDEMFPIIWRIFSPVDDHKDQFSAIDVQDLTMENAFQISKYTMKPMDFDFDDFREEYAIKVGKDIWHAMRAKKNNVPFGNWLSWKKEIEENSEDSNAEMIDDGVQWGYKPNRPLRDVFHEDDDDEMVFSRWVERKKRSFKISIATNRRLLIAHVVEQSDLPESERSVPLLSGDKRRKRRRKKRSYEKRREMYV